MNPLVRSAMLGAVLVTVAASAMPSDAARSSVSGPLAVWQAGFAYALGRVDPATLLPAGKQVELVQGDTPVLSPARRRVALGSESVAAVSVASAVPLRKPGRSTLLLRGSGHVLGLAWPTSRRLLALAGRDRLAPVACCRTLRLFVIDPLERRILRSLRLRPSYVMAVEPTRTGLAILLGGYGRLASARLLLVTQGGAARSVTLSRFKVGFTKLGNGVRATEAALAVGSGSAYVLGGSGAMTSVAVVPLAHGPAEYHSVPAGPELAEPDRGLVVLGGGRLGVASVTGLYVYDTRSWEQLGSVPLQGQIGYVSGDSMIVLGGGSGIDVYNLDGSLRYHLDTVAQVDAVVFVGGRGFLRYQDPNEDWGVLDLDRGSLQPPVVGNIPALIPGQPGVPAFAWTP